MGKELAGAIEKNSIVYHLMEDGCYYPDLGLPEGTHYHIGKYGLMRWEYLTENSRREYFRLLMDGKLNEYLHEVDGECYAMVEQMKAGAGITEELKDANQMKWVGLMNNIWIMAEGNDICVVVMCGAGNCLPFVCVSIAGKQKDWDSSI